MNVFQHDDSWQKSMRDRILAPEFYGNYALDGRYVFIDKGALASRLQREFAVDTIVQGPRDGSAVCIEEKIVRWPKRQDYPYSSFALETRSNTNPGREKDGWMVYGQADFLLYCFANKVENALNAYLIDFPKLKAWFWPRIELWPTTVTEQINHTECRVVPISDVKYDVPCRQYMLGVYDAQSDLSGSLNDCYRAIRERQSAGGNGWTPREEADF
jgi:hypothetical protein